MKRKIHHLINRRRTFDNTVVLKEVRELKILAAKSLIETQQNRIQEILSNICLSEFKVFSQWGDDGIIQFLINYLDIENKSFVEFGVEDYSEANTRFLLENDNWDGLILDGSEENIEKVKASEIHWKHSLTPICAFITAENINNLIASSGFTGPIGLLHIDIDGNDYWVWKAIDVIDPVIVIIEYNSLFGQHPWTIPYSSSFQRTAVHSSNLYFGASVSALCHLAEEKGYDFIGCNNNGNNAYFIKKGHSKNLRILSSKEGYKISKFREGRNEAGELTFMNFDERIKEIQHLPVVDVISGEKTLISI